MSIPNLPPVLSVSHAILNVNDLTEIIKKSKYLSDHQGSRYKLLIDGLVERTGEMSNFLDV
jgi:hypothetical protein